MQNNIFFSIQDRCTNVWHRINFSFFTLKTSTQISLKFTLFTIIQVLLFSLLANVIFFQSWYSRQQTQISPGPNTMIGKMILGKNRTQELEIFAINSQEAQTILQLDQRKNIVNIDNMYFLYKKLGNTIIVSNITSHIVVQKNLIWISKYLIIFFGLLSYILSRFFVKTSLKKLNKLLGFLDNLNINNLNEKIAIVGHPHDEINRVSKKFNEVLAKIHKQTLSLKDFVTNASHELKTPFMSMSSEIDYAMKTQHYQEGLTHVKQQLKNMNILLDTLVMISKLESVATFKKDRNNLEKLLSDAIITTQKIYKKKNISMTLHNTSAVILPIHQESWNIIIKNMLDNAYKFTPTGGTISVNLTNKKFSIINSGKGIAPKDLEHIWERFWQADRSKTDTKSFGLGLYLVKLLVEKHGWTISITSKKDKGTMFTITF